MRVGAGGEADLFGEWGPGGAVAGVDRGVDPLVELDLGASVGGGLLPRPGRAGVLLGDAVGGPEHHQVGQQLSGAAD